jgi:hypothetical protein
MSVCLCRYSMGQKQPGSPLLPCRHTLHLIPDPVLWDPRIPQRKKLQQQILWPQPKRLPSFYIEIWGFGSSPLSSSEVYLCCNNLPWWLGSRDPCRWAVEDRKRSSCNRMTRGDSLLWRRRCACMHGLVYLVCHVCFHVFGNLPKPSSRAHDMCEVLLCILCMYAVYV